ncbi:TPA: ead/Ea22-like family protein [Klebsiella pneumoniae]
MTTDITELAQSLKAAADREMIYRDGAETSEIWERTVTPENILALVEALENSESRLHEVAVACATAEQALEKAQQERDNWCTTFDNERFRADKLKAYIDDMEPIRAAAEKLVRCKGRYHSEQNYRALAALFGVNTPDLPPLEHENVHYADAAEMEIAALRQRIAELEESHAQVIQSRDHYKRMLEEGLEQLAESRTVTVKLPDLRQIVSGDRYVWSDGVYNYSQDVKAILADAGIKVEAE